MKLTVEQSLRLLDILKDLPESQDGVFAPGADVTVAKVLARLLAVSGIHFFYGVGMNLAKQGMPPDQPLR